MRLTIMGKPLPDDLAAILPAEMKRDDYDVPRWLSGLIVHAYTLGREEATDE